VTAEGATSAGERWDRWMLAETACELALFVWRTAPVAERETAYRGYLASLADEERLAAQLSSARV
jgi:hypothetical protein